MMDHYCERRFEQLQQTILDLLRRHPEGLREFDLMAQLTEIGAAGYQHKSLGDPLSLFQSHFLLFHCLYRLRDALRGRAEAELKIHCLNIVLKPYQSPNSTLPQPPDPLRDYYLDLSQLEQTRAEDVDALLHQFWHRFAAKQPSQQALAVLGLTAPVSFDVVKVRYRHLVMAHHPDRGGCTEKLQSINEAMAQLKVSYKRS